MLLKIWIFFVKLIGKIKWEFLYKIFGKKYYGLTKEDHDKIKVLLNPNYYIILTWRKCHLSSYAISLGNKVKTGKWGKWSHCLMNVDEGNIKNEEDFKLMEAIGVGVKFSTFLEVFDCDAVCLLQPNNITAEEWVTIIDAFLKEEGKEYDMLLDLAEDKKVSCVEAVRCALQALPNYKEKFEKFDLMINTIGNLTPDLFYTCPDFKVVLEIRR